ncbi:cation-transporting P-type ATPase [Achromobacter sp. JUb104]|uniref:cation-transporting P-type ATPase n=1 Tax=Achromobacter sp. JUb104 TaxID=2940590 RepID=UPI00216755D3|nr:cation-transporting P-type ATPase [Achromobacter sp. JUb104]MCS3505675.1 magnesium-transporting ATPase (P-type) [Achromobacter sp. JUb104]
MQDAAQEQNGSPWHAQAGDAVLADLKATPKGLDQAEAESRLATFGPNRLPVARQRGMLSRFLAQFHNVLIYVLLGSAAITAFLGHGVDTGVILAVVLANAAIGFIQEGKAEKAMTSIRQMLAPRANVLRDGERRSISGETLVPGDIVLLEAGDRVPADIRLLAAHSLRVQEAVLTGESVPVEKHTNPLATDAALGDRSPMAYCGTLVAAGQGRGVVVATGLQTEIGRISTLLDTVQTLTTPLVKQMDGFGRWLTAVILAVAALLLVHGYFVHGYEFTELFMAVVGLSVAAIPEGLPAVLTITLAIGVQAMAQRNTIVRRLPAIETIGAVSVICTDKTGTLTRNEMVVATVLTPQHVLALDGVGYEPKGSILLDGAAVEASNHGVLQELARAGTLCNDAALRQHDGAWVVEGDPMEGALLAFAEKAGADVQKLRAGWTRTDAIAFDSQTRFMATLCHDHERRAFIYVKGAPERILAMCAHQRANDGGVEPLNTAYWHAESDRIAASGQRLLGFAVRSMKPTHTVLENSDVDGTLTLLGMVGMIDPPRAEAIEAVRACREAGIRVKMITGDHAKTAAAIGAQIGLQDTHTVLTGADLDGLSDAALRQAAQDCDIFARTSPEHKLRLVMALQSQGMIVAMTGDGVNDAPALRRADVGIAMGEKGSEAAKEAAELVLVDENFASIVAAVREGRTVYDNIKKVVSWTLPTNTGEALTVIVALLVGTSLPVTPIQILWVNLVTGVTLGLALAFEPTEENTMRRPPRAPSTPLIGGELAWHILLVSVLFLIAVFGIFHYATASGYSMGLAHTMAFNTLVVMEIFHLFFVRNIYGTSLTWKAVAGTKVVWAMVIAVTAAQFAVTYLPPMQVIFGTESVPVWDGVLIVGVGVVLFAVLEVEKQIRLGIRRARSGTSARRKVLV